MTAPDRFPTGRCPWCHTDDALHCELEPGLERNGRQTPSLYHVTTCEACGATRHAKVSLDTLTGWKNVPGQTSLKPQ